jgi:hypothetical protein
VNGQRARLRINLSQREFEVEGSEAFVKAYLARFDAWLGHFDQAAGPEPDPGPSASLPDPPTEPAPRDLAELTFGELLHRLPRAASDVDRVLLAGWFGNMRSADRSFSTGEASALLTEQGIKVGNPSQSIKQNLTAKRVFKHQGRYRVSQTGLDYLRQLLRADLPG